MRTLRLVLEYDGTHFAGFQIQPGRRTVQGELEAALARITQETIRVVAAGRTDAGVHARGQVVSFRTGSPLPVERLHRALLALLPADITVHRVQEMPPGFHARRDARRRLYRYTILNRPVRPAIGRQYVWHVPDPLDVAAMQAACRYLIGTHDFAAFAGLSSGRRGRRTERTVYRADLWREQAAVIFEIEANAFLPQMVRTIVGTLVEIGRGRREPAAMAAILAARDRRAAGPTAPPQGLCLMRVWYDESVDGDGEEWRDAKDLRSEGIGDPAALVCGGRERPDPGSSGDADRPGAARQA